MQKKILFGAVCLALLVWLTSCKKYLDLKPQDGIIRENYWKTKEQLHAATIGIYASLLGGTDRPIPEYLFMWGELRGGMLANGAVNFNEEVDFMSWNILPTYNLTSWRAFYRTINYCNTIIKFAPEVIKVDKTLSESLLNSYVGEAKAMRALMYFTMAKTFGDVPLKLDATVSDADVVQLAKSPQQEVLVQVVKDLEEAEAALPATYGLQAYDKGRITKYGAIAMLADVHLWMENYAKAVEACDKILKSSRFGLMSGPSFYSANISVGNSNESIFEIQFDQQKLNSFFNLFWRPARFLANSRVADEVFTSDGSNPNNKDFRGDNASVRFSDGIIWKYLRDGIVATNNNDGQAQSFAHWIVYRYAEIYLIKAEALNELGKTSEALDLVTIIRQRANALPATEKSPTEKDGMADYILEERAREFAFEGKRWYDLLRNAKRGNYARLESVLIPVVSQSVRPESQQAAMAKARDKNSHYLPINTYEIQTNRNLVQNPFYK
ncbi:MAG TPA: RagB/SusD family nutrient uptake outer membrane protein [Chitinophagaceae bacterium]|nr:RagB/SusD family nutrient uptake outer membrane protein [Chitinophagaceae bacterium]